MYGFGSKKKNMYVWNDERGPLLKTKTKKKTKEDRSIWITHLQAIFLIGILLIPFSSRRNQDNSSHALRYYHFIISNTENNPTRFRRWHGTAGIGAPFLLRSYISLGDGGAMAVVGAEAVGQRGAPGLVDAGDPGAALVRVPLLQRVHDARRAPRAHHPPRQPVLRPRVCERTNRLISARMQPGKQR